MNKSLSFIVCCSFIFCLEVFAASNSFKGLDIKTSKKVEIDLKKPSKGTVVVFLSARCPCSASHVSEVTALAKEFSAKGFQFVAVHSNSIESEPKDRAYLRALDFKGAVLEDSNFEIADRFGALKTPHVFVVSPSGQIVYSGGVSDQSDFAKAKEKYLRQALNQIVKGVSVEPSKTLAMGCAIKR